MPYVNFKEENYKLVKDFQKRKEDNLSTRKKLDNNKELLSGYKPFNDKFSFKKNKNAIIGKNGPSKEEDFIVFEDESFICAGFYNCKLQNIKFKNCRFIGCRFEKCLFSSGGVVFDNCVFVHRQSFENKNLNKEDNFFSYFYECSLYARFVSCDMSYVVFENTKFKDTNFELSDLSYGILYNCNLEDVKVEDCDFSSFKTYKCYMKDFSFEDKYLTKFDEKTYFDKLFRVKDDRAENEGLYQIYQNIANKYKDNNLNNNFGEYYFLGKREQYRTLDLLPKIGSRINFLACGYGERPLYSVYFGLGLIILFSFLYLIVGIEIDNQLVAYNNINAISNISFAKFYREFMEALSLSVGMFAGIGVENSIPARASYMIANVEMILGLIVVGVGIGSLTKKVIR